MTAIRLMVLAAAGLALAGCNAPTPLYSLQKTPPPYRKAADGAIIDNAGVPLDACQEFRLVPRIALHGRQPVDRVDFGRRHHAPVIRAGARKITGAARSPRGGAEWTIPKPGAGFTAVGIPPALKTSGTRLSTRDFLYRTIGVFLQFRRGICAQCHHATSAGAMRV